MPNSRYFPLKSSGKRRRESRHIRQWDGRSWWRWSFAVRAVSVMSEGSGNKTGKKLKFDSETLDEVCDRLPGIRKRKLQENKREGGIAGQEKRLKGDE